MKRTLTLIPLLMFFLIKPCCADEDRFSHWYDAFLFPFQVSREIVIEEAEPYIPEILSAVSDIAEKTLPIQIPFLQNSDEEDTPKVEVKDIIEKHDGITRLGRIELTPVGIVPAERIRLICEEVPPEPIHIGPDRGYLPAPQPDSQE